VKPWNLRGGPPDMDGRRDDERRHVGPGAAATGGPTVWCRLTDADHNDGGTSRMLDSLVGASPL